MNKEKFSEIIDKGITIVDFFAEWCLPCKGQSAVLDYLRKDESIKGIKFLQLDVDKEGNEIASDFKIKSIPTIIIFRDGQEKSRSIGVTGSEELTKTIGRIQNE